LAASSAAILLTHGDYAIAYPKSIIHFHGVRSYRQREEAADVARDLKATNKISAVALARTRSRNFFLRFITLRSDFPVYRTSHPEVTSEKQCFVHMISENWLPAPAPVRAPETVDRFERSR
jgi:hypothetical protein